MEAAGEKAGREPRERPQIEVAATAGQSLANIDSIASNIDKPATTETKPANSDTRPDNESNPTNNDRDDELDFEFEIDEKRIVRHIMVIGFHHKHGYQVDYCYPPMQPNGPTFSTPSKPIMLPDCWKTLPLLCLPDGSHNYDNDTIYFTMPDSDATSSTNSNLHHHSDPSTEQSFAHKDHDVLETEDQVESNTCDNSLGIKTIFGTACYRQIQADKLLNRTDDMTRIAVQKSVCVLSTKPLFGLIRSKLEMITHAYFEELDFSKVRILKLTFENLNSLLARDSVKDNATYLGLSARQVVSHFGYNTLVLFKAMLLEKKILFYKSPVRDLCSTILSMCSLFTGLLESGGLDRSTCDLQLSTALLEALKLPPSTPTSHDDTSTTEANKSTREDKVFFSPSKEKIVIISSESTAEQSDPQQSISHQLAQLEESINDDTQVHGKSPADASNKQVTTDLSTSTGCEYELINEEPVDSYQEPDQDDDQVSLADESLVDDQYAIKLCRLKPEECGLPLQIFTKGSFCLPYLSITYLDLLSDPRVRSFVIGATNVLFKHKRDMYDVLVDMEENSITINDHHLRKCLSLSTEDLRFMDSLTRQVKLENHEPGDEFDLMSHDITKWVGSDEWIRYHFRLYTIYLLKASKNKSAQDSFNSNFVQTWKQTTNNYRTWDATGKVSLLNSLLCKHPASSPSKVLNLNDVKLKLSYAVMSSEKGRMINQTLNGIGKWSIWGNIAAAAAAATTSASSTLSSTISSVATNSSNPVAHVAQRTFSSFKDQDKGTDKP